MIPKTKHEYDIEKYRALESEWDTVVKENCVKCSICGASPRLSASYDGWQIRIVCSNYRDQPPHGNIADDIPNKRFTEWYTGEDNLKNAIEEWNAINKIEELERD